MERSSRADPMTPATPHSPSQWVPPQHHAPFPGDSTALPYRIIPTPSLLSCVRHSSLSSSSSSSSTLSSSPLSPLLHLPPLRLIALPSPMGDLRDSLAPPLNHSNRSTPVREDCWSEEATSTLVDAWGRRYIELNRGNLRQKDWQDVADAVNALHGHTKKTHRTDVQCKNRIDTVKKKYKVEKNRVSSPNGAPSTWPFFDRLDVLIGPTLNTKKASPSPPMALSLPYRKTPSPASAVPSMAVALPQKRLAAAFIEDGYLRRNYSAMAAAAAAAESDDDEDEEEEEEEDEEEERGSEVAEVEREKEGMRQLAKAIERFGEVYERMERQKLRQMVDLEKQRMQFTKDLEVQRMQMYMDTQVQLERIKRGKRSGSNGDILHDSILGSWEK